jgi:hypothetical protein
MSVTFSSVYFKAQKRHTVFCPPLYLRSDDALKMHVVRWMCVCCAVSDVHYRCSRWRVREGTAGIKTTDILSSFPSFLTNFLQVGDQKIWVVAIDESGLAFLRPTENKIVRNDDLLPLSFSSKGLQKSIDVCLQCNFAATKIMHLKKQPRLACSCLALRL